MGKKLRILAICFVFAGFVFVGPYAGNIFALDDENEISYEAMIQLQNIAGLQGGYSSCCGSYYPRVKCGANPIC